MRTLHEAKVLQIFTCDDKGKPMLVRDSIRALAGVGLEGDRYALGRGAYSKDKRQPLRHVSLVGIEAIAAANSTLETSFKPAETRRNILTKGIDLNELVGVEFAVGEVAMRGVELCTPCARPSKLAEKPYFKQAFDDRGGLRAEILSSGLIAVNDSIRA